MALNPSGTAAGTGESWMAGWTRRRVLGHLSVAGLAAGGGWTPAAPAQPGTDITFFVMADPQIHLDKWGTAGTERTIDTMNALPGRPFPFGGVVAEPRAVVICGDLVDDAADPRHWRCYERLFSPNGRARLRFRVIEGIGNHDLTAESATGFSVIQREVVARHQRRDGPEKLFYDARGYHHSWDWGALHLVQLHLFPGREPRPVYDRPAAWNNPAGSLDFLMADLKERVGDTGRPVILLWHYGLRGWGLEKWWTPEDLSRLREAIAPYNIVLILHGHEHAYARYEWEGYPVIMAPSPQFDRDPKRPDLESTPKGFLVVRVTGDRLQVACHQAGDWGETWERTITLGKETAPEPR